MKKRISLLLVISLLLSIACIFTACNGGGDTGFDTTGADTLGDEETTAPSEDIVSIFEPTMAINSIARVCNYRTTTYDLATLLPEGGELTVANKSGETLDSSSVKLATGTNVFQVLYKKGYLKKAYVISIARRDTHRVIFNTNGGSYIAPLALSDGSMINVDDYTPTRGSGYTFAGWYLGDELVTGQQAVLSDTTFIARWTAPQTPVAANTQDFYTYTTSSATINIVWKDYDDAFKLRPTEVYCTLTDTVSSATYRVRLTKTTAEFVGAAPSGASISQGAGNWTVKITGLTGEYRFVQDNLKNSNYTSAQSGTAVTNTYKDYLPALDDTAWLMTSNGRLYDLAGNLVTLKGVVTHNVGWDAFENNNSIAALKRLQQEGANCVRITMFVTSSNDIGYYASNGVESTEAQRAELRRQLKVAIDNATSLGMYCIVNWGILASVEMTPAVNACAKELFTTLATEYKDNPFVAYEICNEPKTGTWGSIVVPYAEDVIASIRQHSNALVILAPDAAATNLSAYSKTEKDPIDTPISSALSHNVAYTFHCYAGTYRYNGSGTVYSWKLKAAVDAGLTLVWTEFSPAVVEIGSTSLTVDLDEANKFLNFILENDQSYMLFRYMSGGSKDSAQYMFLPNYQKNLNNGTWTYDMLQNSGKWFYDNALHSTGFIKHADF